MIINSMVAPSRNLQSVLVTGTSGFSRRKTLLDFNRIISQYGQLNNFTSLKKDGLTFYINVEPGRISGMLANLKSKYYLHDNIVAPPMMISTQTITSQVMVNMYIN